jgi:hypothetical protein
MHVINFDLPSADHDGKNEYVHRIGMVPSPLFLFPTDHKQVALHESEMKDLQRRFTTRNTMLLALSSPRSSSKPTRTYLNFFNSSSLKARL